MKKLNKFKGKIDFSASPEQISKVLDELKSYLNSYGEDEAADIVEKLKGNSSGSKPSHQEKLQTKEFLKKYEDRNETLRKIAKSIKQIQEDLHDEQDTSYKKRGKVKSAVSKVYHKVTGAAKSVINKAKDFSLMDLLSLGKGLLGILGSIGSFFSALPGMALGLLGGGLVSLGLWVLGKFYSATKWFGKQLVRLGVWLVRTSIKVGKWVWNQAKRLGKWVFEKTKGIAKWLWEGVTVAAKWLGGKFKSVWEWLKKKTGFDTKKGPTKPTKPDPKNSKAKTAATNGKKTPAKNKGKSWIDKGKEAVSKMKEVAGKLGGKGFGKLAKAIGKAAAAVGTRAIPFAGWALLGYDAYQAARKSDSLINFGVNLLDEISFGAISTLVNFNGYDSVGHYVEAIMEGKINAPAESESANSASTQSTANSSVNGNSVELARKEMQENAKAKESETKKAKAAGKALLTSAEFKKLSEDGKLKYIYNNNLEKHTEFDRLIEKWTNGEMTLDEVYQVISGGASPSKISNVPLASINQTEALAIKEAAVVEATQNAMKLAQMSLLGAAQMSSQVIQTSSNTVIPLVVPINSGMQAVSVQS